MAKAKTPVVRQYSFERLTIHEAQKIAKGTLLYHTVNRNKDGTPERWRVSGVPQTWKTRPDCVKVPVRRGLYKHENITESSLCLFSTGYEVLK